MKLDGPSDPRKLISSVREAIPRFKEGIQEGFVTSRDAIMRALLKTRVDEANFASKKRNIFDTELMGNRTPALTYDYDLTLQSSLSSKTYWRLVLATEINHPAAAVSFNNDKGSGYRITAGLQDYENVKVTYWDTMDWFNTLIINRLFYQPQFVNGDEENLLVEGFAHTILNIRSGPLTRIYDKCAISKPSPVGFSADNALLKFSFEVAYNSYSEKFEADFNKEALDPEGDLDWSKVELSPALESLMKNPVATY